jgi:hypothetical protein
MYNDRRMARQAISARPNEARTAGRQAYAQSLDRTERRSGTVLDESNTVQEPGRAAWAQLDRANIQCGYEIVTGNIFHPVGGDAYYR